MRASPPFQFKPERSSVWGGVVLALWLLAVGASGAWAWTLIQVGEVSWLAFGLVLCLAGGCGYGLLVAWRDRPGFVRWNGRSWQWGPSASATQGLRSGRAVVCIDLAHFLLIRLESSGPRAWFCPAVWLPLDRQNHLPIWHLLRCALRSQSDVVEVQAAQNELV